MSVVLVDPARSKFGSPQLFEGSDAEFAEAARGCVAYTGRWKMRGGKVVHEADVSLFPNWMGTELVRSCEFVGNRLSLSTAGFAIRGVEYTARMVWEREL
jgi:hypothetical protein